MNLWRSLQGVAVAALLLCSGLSPAQNRTTSAPAPNAKSKPAATKAAPAKEQERIQIENADTLTREGDIWHLRGNVVFARRDMKMMCDMADYDEKADTAKASGHLRITDPDSVITGDLMDADFGKEVAVITGNITIVTRKKGNKQPEAGPELALAKPNRAAGKAAAGGKNSPAGSAPGQIAPKHKESGKPEHFEDYWRKKSTITCERLEYYYSDDVKRMIATPRVKAVQEDKTAWADTAVFEDIARTLTLTGNVVVTTDKGDEMRCSKATIWVDEDKIQAEGAIRGTTLHKGKKEEPKPAPVETKPTTPSAGVKPKPGVAP